jgi:hypothetical protein
MFLLLTTLSLIAQSSTGETDTLPCPACNQESLSIDAFVISGTVAFGLFWGGIAGIIAVKVNIKRNSGESSIKGKNIPRLKNYSLRDYSPKEKQAFLAKPSIARNGHDKISSY